MNGEQKYNEALERARTEYKNHESFNGFRVMLLHIFPELEESDDERIRNEIITYLSTVDDKELIPYESWIAWLERNVEQKPLEEGTFVNVDEVREDFMQEVYRVLDADPTNDRANQIIDAFDSLPTLEFEKHSEQKPDNVETKFKVKYAGSEYSVQEVKDIAGITFYGIEDELNHIDYIKADSCEIINGGYGIKENGCSFPTKSIIFSE